MQFYLSNYVKMHIALTWELMQNCSRPWSLIYRLFIKKFYQFTTTSINKSSIQFQPHPYTNHPFISTTWIRKSCIQSTKEIKSHYTFKTIEPSCSQYKYNHLHINNVFSLFTKRDLSYKEKYINTASFTHASTWTTNHKIAQT